MKIIINLMMLLLFGLKVYSQEGNANYDTIKVIQYHNKQTNKNYESISFEYQKSLSLVKKHLEIRFDSFGIFAETKTINESKLEYKTVTRIQYDSLNFEELVEMFNKCLQVKLKNSNMIFIDGDHNCIKYITDSGQIEICFSQPNQGTEQRGLKDFLELRSKIISICHQTDEILKR